MEYSNPSVQIVMRHPRVFVVD